MPVRESNTARTVVSESKQEAKITDSSSIEVRPLWELSNGREILDENLQLSHAMPEVLVVDPFDEGWLDDSIPEAAMPKPDFLQDEHSTRRSAPEELNPTPRNVSSGHPGLPREWSRDKHSISVRQYPEFSR